jgi:hypothetical protein
MRLTTFYAQSLPLGSGTTSSVGAPPSLEPTEGTVDSLEVLESGGDPCGSALDPQQNLGFLSQERSDQSSDLRHFVIRFQKPLFFPVPNRGGCSFRRWSCGSRRQPHQENQQRIAATAASFRAPLGAKGLQDAACLRCDARGFFCDGAPPLIGGFFMTTNPHRSRGSTSRLASIRAIISPASCFRLRPRSAVNPHRHGRPK